MDAAVRAAALALLVEKRHGHRVSGRYPTWNTKPIQTSLNQVKACCWASRPKKYSNIFIVSRRKVGKK